MSRTGSARMLASFPASLASSGPIGFALPDPASLHSTFGRMYASLYFVQTLRVKQVIRVRPSHGQSLTLPC